MQNIKPIPDVNSDEIMFYINSLDQAI